MGRGVPTPCAPCHAGDRHVGRVDIEPDPEVLPLRRGGDGVGKAAAEGVEVGLVAAQRRSGGDRPRRSNLHDRWLYHLTSLIQHAGLHFAGAVHHAGGQVHSKYFIMGASLRPKGAAFPKDKLVRVGDGSLEGEDDL